MTESIQKKISAATTVEPEGHFFEAARKMLCRDITTNGIESAFSLLKRGILNS